MQTKSINQSITEIAKDVGLHKSEISLALNAKRLLNRAKLKKIVDANYPLEAFVFGRDYYENNTKQDQEKSNPSNQKEVSA